MLQTPQKLNDIYFKTPYYDLFFLQILFIKNQIESLENLYKPLGPPTLDGL